jgi:hypothetical protein
MIRKRTILSLALLASTAACGGGGSSSGGGTPAAGGSPGAGAALPSTNFQSPSIVVAADGTATMAADQTSQSWVQTGAGTVADPDILHVQLAGLNYSNDYNLSTLKDPTIAAYANNVFQQMDGADGSTIIMDTTLTAGAYGIWLGPNGQKAVFGYGTDTPVSDIPQTGAATYKGNASGFGQTGGNLFTLVGGATGTTINVDFPSRQVTGTIDMTAQSNATGDTAQLLVNINQAALAPNSNKISGTISSNTTSTIIPTALSGTTTAKLIGAGAAEIVGVGNLAGGNTTAQFSFGGRK